MKAILRRIINKNKLAKNGENYISKLLYDVLTDSRSPTDLVKHQINNQLYIDLKSIPREIRDELGLNTHFGRSADHDETDGGETSVDYPIIELRKALTGSFRYEPNFRSSFIDKKIISKKARTLSLLNEITAYQDNEKYLLKLYHLLKKRKIDTDLSSQNFEEFYKKVKWFFKTGLYDGCLNFNKNPYL